jgi:hypothetical protein
LAQNPSPGGGKMAVWTGDRGLSAECRVSSRPMALPSSANSAAMRTHRQAVRREIFTETIDEMLES